MRGPKPKPFQYLLSLFLLSAALGHAPSVQAEAMLTGRCSLFYSPRFEASIIDCQGWNPMIADLDMDDAIGWSAFKDYIERKGRGFKVSRPRHVETLAALRGLLDNCLSESCQLDPNLSKEDVTQLRAVLDDQGNLKGQRIRRSSYSSVLDRIDLFYIENPSLKVVFGYPEKNPLNHVKPHTFFHIFIWK
ncbi:MAG: hypothetical protein ACWA40_04755 [Planktomarina sp.]